MLRLQLLRAKILKAIFRFSVLIGPLNHVKHLVSKERLPFSLVYFGSLGLTLYSSLGVSNPCLSDTNELLTYPQAHSYLGSLIFGGVQVCRRSQIAKTPLLT